MKEDYKYLQDGCFVVEPDGTKTKLHGDIFSRQSQKSTKKSIESFQDMSKLPPEKRRGRYPPWIDDPTVPQQLKDQVILEYIKTGMPMPKEAPINLVTSTAKSNKDDK